MNDKKTPLAGKPSETEGNGHPTSALPLNVNSGNGLVYELYFPEEVHGAGLQLFDLVQSAKLPDLDAIPEDDRLPRLRRLFETLYDGTHPLRIALAKLQNLDTVRIIEGKT